MPSALERLFTLLFKYRPVVFQEGRLTFDVPRPVALVVAALALAAGVAMVASYRRAALGRGHGGARALLLGLRLVALTVLAVCLVRPTLVLSASLPGRNTVAVLLDDSRSMRVADQGGRPRGEWVGAALAPTTPLVRRLAEQFTVRTYRYARTAERVESAAALDFTGDRTRLGPALERVRADLAGLPLAGVVVVGDGADGDPAALAAAALALRAQGTPLFTVGVGAERAERDLEVTRVSAPPVVLRGSTVAVDAVVTHAGFGGATVPVVVEDGGRVIARQEVRLPDEAGAAPVRLQVPAAEAGDRRLTVRVAAQEREAGIENNQRETLVRVADTRERVLYFEGEPRSELAFVRRAVADDENLRVVALLRSAQGKYLRLGVGDSLDLLSGFPSTREELFSYQAVVLGSVEASAFTPDQLRMLADFVGERGGGLLMLGGRRAFAEGGYGGTALADVLPVVLEPAAGDGPDAIAVTELTVRPTAAGAAMAPLQLAATERASAQRWQTLPPLTAVNVVRRAKPGATVLLTGAPTAPAGGARVVLAHQRYGRGRAVAFAVQDSWLWQMMPAVEDPTFEQLWRQLLRWLVSGAPGAVTVAASAERPAPDEAVALTAEVRDSAYRTVNGARVMARVTAPSGASSEVPLEWAVARDGEYRGSFTPAERGAHRVEVVATADGGTPLGAAEPLALDVADPRDEYFDSGMRAPLLQRLAAETGGRFYTPATVGTLPEDLRYARSGVTVVERRELWDMPALYLLLGAALAAEWAVRRVRGLA